MNESDVACGGTAGDDLSSGAPDGQQEVGGINVDATPLTPPADAETADGAAETPGLSEAPVSPEKYAEGIVPEKGARWFFEQDLVRQMAPALQELGLSQEQGSKLANAFARTQYDQALKEQAARNERMSAFNAAVKEMTIANPKVLDQARSAIEHFFADSPVLKEIFYKTELGCDPKMITLLAYAGRGLAEAKGLPGAEAGVSGSRQASFAEILSGGLIK